MGQLNRKPVSIVSACGAYMVRARIIQSAEGFVTSMNLELIGHELATAGKAAALNRSGRQRPVTLPVRATRRKWHRSQAFDRRVIRDKPRFPVALASDAI
jgi:hypothetical protein